MRIKLLGPLLAGTNASLQNTQVEDLVNEGAKAVIVNPETATSLRRRSTTPPSTT